MGLAGVYSDRGDMKGASALLEKLTQKDPIAARIDYTGEHLRGDEGILAGGGYLQEGHRIWIRIAPNSKALWRRIWRSPSDTTKR